LKLISNLKKLWFPDAQTKARLAQIGKSYTATLTEKKVT